MNEFLNEKHLGDSSEKLKKCSMLIDYVYTKLIENQEVKRLVYYNTQNPLDEKGIDFNNEIIDQPDLTKEDVKDLITMSPFNAEMVEKLTQAIYINIPFGSFYNYGQGNILKFDVDILSPEEFALTVNGLRYFEIGYYIANMLDGIYITDDRYVEYLGNLKFDLESLNTFRLSKTNTKIWLHLVFEVKLFPMDRT